MANQISGKRAGNGWLTRTDRHPLDRLRDEMEQMVDRYFGDWPALFEGGWGRERFWDVNVDETDQEVVVRAEAPGFEPGEFDVDVRGDMLTIRAEHKHEAEEGQGPGTGRWEHLKKGEMLWLLPVSSSVLSVFLPRSPPARSLSRWRRILVQKVLVCSIFYRL